MSSSSSMQAKSLCLAAAALACCVVQLSAAECGVPYGPCGSAVPTDVLCKAGPGWCTPGFYCAAENNTAPSKCLPSPECGRAGQPCCPSNVDAPHAASIQKVDRKPFCRDGSTCFYDPTTTYLTLDIHAGIAGWLGCAAVPQDCGSGPGTTCCPNLFTVATNPVLPRSGCPGNTFCDPDPSTPSFPGSSLVQQPPGTCRDNTPDCGVLGKACCVSNRGATTALRCVPEGGQRGYCADVQGRTSALGARESQLMCTLCPAAVNDTLRVTDPDTFFRCGGSA